MDGTFVEAFKDAIEAPTALTVGGDERVFVPKGWTEHRRPDRPQGTPLVLHSLTGLVGYLVGNPDNLVAIKTIVHIKDPGEVQVRGSLEDEDTGFRRLTVVRTTTEMVGPGPMAFGGYMDAETFYVALQSGFISSPQRDNLLALIASIREGSVRETTDDGVAQEVKTSRGVTLLDRTKVGNPHYLRPFRTFRELEQPASTFILRLQGDPNSSRPKCALFEAEGGRWKLDAIQAIAEYLHGKLPAGYHIIA